VKRFPPYPARPHSSKQARIRHPGTGRHVYLGVHSSPASWAEYQRLLSEWRAGRLSSPGRPDNSSDNRPDNSPARTVRDLVGLYLRHLESRAARKGDARGAGDAACALAPLCRLLGHLPVVDLRPLALSGALAAAASGAWLSDAERAARRAAGHKLTWSRPYARRCLGRWKAAVRWAEAQELVPAGTSHGLAVTPGLEEGQAEDRPRVVPAPEDAVAAALPCLHPVTRALVECLLLTGARPGELFRLTPADLNRTGEVELAGGYRVKLGAGVWAYQPLAHKSAYRGHRRVVLLGPRAQAVLTPLLAGRAPGTPVFCPREARHAIPEGSDRAPRLRYDRHTLRQAVARACDHAGVPRFTPYQLRHNAASRLAAEFGPEVARIVLGHADLKVTATYVLDDLRKAADALGQVG
jgi:integrase